MKPVALILINALHSGGTEKTCIQLAHKLESDFDVEVISLTIGGPAEAELRSLGINVTVLGATGIAQMVVALARLARKIRVRRPEAIITFLYISDLVGGLLTRLLAPKAKIFWNIRNNVLSQCHIGRASYAVTRINAYLSRWLPDVITYCSPVAQGQHALLGYRCKRSYVIENSSRSVPFSFSPGKRSEFRQSYGFCDDDFVFLLVGRFDPVKCVDKYIDACATYFRRGKDHVYFAIAGREMMADNQWLQNCVETTGIPERFRLLGFVSDQQALYSAADCLVVTSESEGSPNVIYEAIATQLPVTVLGTAGTEEIADACVHRIDSRNVEELVELMWKVRHTSGIHGPDARLRPGQHESALNEHPLITFYKEVLLCREAF